LPCLNARRKQKVRLGSLQSGFFVEGAIAADARDTRVMEMEIEG
jgi:hypothetical protein